jgi:23S rRNA pseudouridine1911/1915/1917 synthase
VEKKYLALAQGNFDRLSGIFEGPVGRHPADRFKMAVIEGGRASATEYRVLWRRPRYSFLICEPRTGRTHQIRVHMAAAGRPLAGDVLYGAQRIPGFERVFLHSWKLSFIHPATGRALSFTRPLPLELRAFLAFSRAQAGIGGRSVRDDPP